MERFPETTRALDQERDLGLAYVRAFFDWLASPAAPADAATLALDELLDRYAGIDTPAWLRERATLLHEPVPSAPCVYRTRLVSAHLAGTLRLDRARLPAGEAGLRYLLARAQAAHLPLRAFRRRAPLHRATWAIEQIGALAPSNLLYVGLGDGHVLLTLLDAFPALRVSVLDATDAGLDLVRGLRRGGGMVLGGTWIGAAHVATAAIPRGHADVTVALEVLEHVADVDLLPTARALLRVTRRAVLVSVPAQPDANPSHLRTFTAESLAALWQSAGATKVEVSTVPMGSAPDAPPRPGHLVARIEVPVSSEATTPSGNPTEDVP